MTGIAEERDLLRRAREGDAQAFAELLRPHDPLLRAIALQMTGNEADAEDIAQEARLRAFASLRSFDGRSRFGTWLIRIAIRAALRHRSRESRRARKEEQAAAIADSLPPGPLEQVQKDEQHQRLRKALRELNPEL